MKKSSMPSHGVHRQRERPVKLAQKLLRIRESLGLSQNELITELELPPVIKQRQISAWEHAYREPNLPTLIKYAKAANVCLEVLVRDDLELPAELPARRTYHKH